ARTVKTWRNESPVTFLKRKAGDVRDSRCSLISSTLTNLTLCFRSPGGRCARRRPLPLVTCGALRCGSPRLAYCFGKARFQAHFRTPAKKRPSACAVADKYRAVNHSKACHVMLDGQCRAGHRLNDPDK